MKSEKIKQGELETLVVSDIPNWVRLYGSILIEYIHAIAQFIGAFITTTYRYTVYIVGNSVLFLSTIVPILMGEKVRDIASVAQKSLKCCRDGVTVCKGDTRFAEFTKRKMGNSLI